MRPAQVRGVGSALFVYCRAGFERECEAEILAAASAAGPAPGARAERGAGYVLVELAGAGAARRLHRTQQLETLVFARQWFVVAARHDDLPRGDRVAPLVAGLRPRAPAAGELFLDTPDSAGGRALSRLCRSLAPPLRAALTAQGLLQPAATRWRLHVCLLAPTRAVSGYSLLANSAPWRMGIPRLRPPPGAPSRSALKLEEALLRFLPAGQRERALQPGSHAVDLGAAPGGWTRVLLERGASVTAVDNGPLHASLRREPRLEHLRVDGFRYRPPRAVEWLVCDMAAQPMRVARLGARWMAQGWCRRAVLTLKLPMKRRREELLRCLGVIDGVLAAVPRGRFRVSCKQLYHDREEVTVYLERAGRGRSAADAVLD